MQKMQIQKRKCFLLFLLIEMVFSSCRQGGTSLSESLYKRDLLNDNEVATKKIQDNAITSQKIKDKSISSKDIQDQAITSEKLASLGAQQAGEMLIWNGKQWVASTQGPWLRNGKLRLGAFPDSASLASESLLILKSTTPQPHILLETINPFDSASTLRIHNQTASTNPAHMPQLDFHRAPTQGATPSGVFLGSLIFSGADQNETDFNGAEIKAQLLDNQKATQLLFQTTPSGGSLPLSRFVVKPTGEVGIGTLSPQAQLDVAGGIKLGTDSTCDTTKKGTLRYDFSTNRPQFCDGSSWKPLFLTPEEECVQLGGIWNQSQSPPCSHIRGRIVAGGLCLMGISSLWDPQAFTYGGASCSPTPCFCGSISQVVCPTGTVKWVLFKLTNANRGGEGALCLKNP